MINQIPSSPMMIVNDSFLYHRLPSQTLKLSILKLDASSFYVEVAKTANVAELKKAVEAAFGYMPQKGPGKISWPHVWGQFCLSYEGHKLVTDTDYLRDYGIKDGNQLQFIPHVSNISNTSSFQRRGLKKRVVKLKQLRRSSSQINRHPRKEHGGDGEICLDDIETGNTQNWNAQENSSGKSRLTRFFEGLFSHTRQSVVRRAKIEARIWPSVISKGVVSSFRKIRRILCYCRRQCYIRRHSWREFSI
ncbi:uncharacterized protein LOC130732170 isoform X2 [Lotus japonicus]|uniref:uncharacterized protein LOC130732170 isoform X2 n=1 Tax=Lotus japonicus TaxID=34305 RepID=UPI002589C0EC|nr:uncharacterized protein LOC130732170 isoform X2 [Lotus japonicus]